MSEPLPEFFQRIRLESKAALDARRDRFALKRPWAERARVFEQFVREDYPNTGEFSLRAVHEADDGIDADHLVVCAERETASQDGACGIYRVTDDALRSGSAADGDPVSMRLMCDEASIVFVNSTEQARAIVAALREAFGDEVTK